MKNSELKTRPFGEPLARYLCPSLLSKGKVYKLSELIKIYDSYLMEHRPNENIDKQKVRQFIRSMVKKKPFEKNVRYKGDIGYYRYIGSSGDGVFQIQLGEANNDTSTNDERAEQTFGDGKYEVYAWCQPMYKENPDSNGCYPIKIGKTGSEGVLGRLSPDTKANLPECPIYLLSFRFNDEVNVGTLENVFHKILELRNKKIKNVHGAEWFQTNPEEIIEIYKFATTPTRSKK